MDCVSRKRVFENESLAIEALVQNHIRNEYKPGEGPRNIYQCTECGYWHFTSKGADHELFRDSEIISRIKNERRSYMWEHRLR